MAWLLVTLGAPYFSMFNTSAVQGCAQIAMCICLEMRHLWSALPWAPISCSPLLLTLGCTLYCCVPPGFNPAPSCGFPIIPKGIPKTRARCRRVFPEADTFHRCVHLAIKSLEGINLCISRAPVKSKRFCLGLSANRRLVGLENQLRSEDK